MNHAEIRTSFYYWGAACLLSAILCALARSWMPSDSLHALILGWVLVSCFAAAGYPLAANAIGTSTPRFLLMGVGGQLVSLALLLIIFAAVLRLENSFTSVFVSAGMISYFVHLFAEVAWLARGAAMSTAST